MSNTAVQFGPFRLDTANRRLSRNGQTVVLNARYMDVLILLVQAGGELVIKDRFMDEVWRGVPVTDEALTQAIRTLRRTLEDSASAPQFIETVPKHGYRFIAPVKAAQGATGEPKQSVQTARSHFIKLTLVGSGGAMLGGTVDGLLYGLFVAAQPPAGGGAMSLLLVLLLISIFSAGVAGAGISAGIAASQFIRPLRWYWTMVGGALGGVIVGGFGNLVGQDAFRLLFGQAVGEFAGAFEGLILGGIVGLAAFIARQHIKSASSIAALLGAGAGLVIVLLDGRMMAGSLHGLVSAFPSSHLRLDGIGPISKTVTGAFEGAVFSAGIVWAVGRNLVWKPETSVEQRNALI